jgi:hypothetical protein
LTVQGAAASNMSTFDVLPAPAVRLITRLARSRRIAGTNRYALITRAWRDAAKDDPAEEQLDLLLPLPAASPPDGEGLLPAAITRAFKWLEVYGGTVVTLQVTYDTSAAWAFQQLPVATAPFTSLARLEVDGPDSLVDVAPALPHLVRLTRLRASISLLRTKTSSGLLVQTVFGLRGAPLLELPSLQGSCPCLKSLHLGLLCTQHITSVDSYWLPQCDARLRDLLPDNLEQLHLEAHSQTFIGLPCASLTSLGYMQTLTLSGMNTDNLNLLLEMPGLQQLHMGWAGCQADGGTGFLNGWMSKGLCTVPDHLTKLTGARLISDPVSAEPLLPYLTNVQQLTVILGRADGVPLLRQVTTTSSLRHLQLKIMSAQRGPAALVSALGSMQQLTCLTVDAGVDNFIPCGPWHAEEVRCSWAQALQQLTQLRVLAVPLELLQAGMAAELTSLVLLQCLYVHSGSAPAQVLEQVAGCLRALPSSLQAVLCWPRGTLSGFDHNTRLVVPEGSPLGGVHISFWHGWRTAAQQGLVLVPRPCPHLPGVWELQQEAATGRCGVPASV